MATASSTRSSSAHSVRSSASSRSTAPANKSSSSSANTSRTTSKPAAPKDRTTVSREARQPQAAPSPGSQKLVKGLESNFSADPQKAAAATAAQPQPAAQAPAANPQSDPNAPLPTSEAARIGGLHANIAVGSLQNFGKISPTGPVAGASQAFGAALAPLNLEVGRQGMNQGLNALQDGIKSGDGGKIVDAGLQTAVGAGGFTAGVAGTTQLLSTLTGVALPSATAVAATGALGGAAAVGFDGLRQTINSTDNVGRGIGLTKMGAAGALATAGMVTAGIISAPAIVAAAPFLLAGGAIAAGGAYLADTETGRKVINSGLDMAGDAGTRAMARIRGLLGG